MKDKIEIHKSSIAPIKAAFCLRGAVSRINGQSLRQNDIYNESKMGKYIDFCSVFQSIKKHIFDANNNIKFDVFIHSWSYDLENDLDSLYKPALSVYEDNKLYNDEILNRCKSDTNFSNISQALSIKKVIEIQESYSNDYSYVIIYRPDVVLLKDMILSNYDVDNNIYVNRHKNSNGDFHFVMSQKNARLFKNLYDSIYLGNICKSHYWIKNYITNYMMQNIKMDNIVPGINQEVLRPNKIKNSRMDPNVLKYYECNNLENS